MEYKILSTNNAHVHICIRSCSCAPETRDETMFPFHTENVEENNYKQVETGRIEASTMSSPLNHISRRPSFGASAASSCSIHLVYILLFTNTYMIVTELVISLPQPLLLLLLLLMVFRIIKNRIHLSECRLTK